MRFWVVIAFLALGAPTFGAQAPSKAADSPESHEKPRAAAGERSSTAWPSEQTKGLLFALPRQEEQTTANDLLTLLKKNRDLILSAAKLLDQDLSDVCQGIKPTDPRADEPTDLIQKNFRNYLEYRFRPEPMTQLKLSNSFFCPLPANPQATEAERKAFQAANSRCLVNLIMQLLMDEYGRQFAITAQAMGQQEFFQAADLKLIEFGSRAMAGWGSDFATLPSEFLGLRIMQAALETKRMPKGLAAEALEGLVGRKPGASTVAHLEALRLWAQTNLRAKKLIPESHALLRTLDEQGTGEPICQKSVGRKGPLIDVYGPNRTQGWSQNLTGESEPFYQAEALQMKDAEQSLIQSLRDFAEQRRATGQPFGVAERLHFLELTPQERDSYSQRENKKLATQAQVKGLTPAQLKADRLAGQVIKQTVAYLEKRHELKPDAKTRAFLLGLHPQELKKFVEISEGLPAKSQEFAKLLASPTPEAVTAAYEKYGPFRLVDEKTAGSAANAQTQNASRASEAIKEVSGPMTRGKLKQRFGEYYQLRTGQPIESLIHGENTGDFITTNERDLLLDLLKRETNPTVAKLEFKNTEASINDLIAEANRQQQESEKNLAPTKPHEPPRLADAVKNQTREQLLARAGLLEARLAANEDLKQRIDHQLEQIQTQKSQPGGSATPGLETAEKELVRLRELLTSPHGVQADLRRELNAIRDIGFNPHIVTATEGHHQLVMPCLKGLRLQRAVMGKNGDYVWEDISSAFLPLPDEEPVSIPDSERKALVGMDYLQLSEYCTGLATDIAKENTRAYTPTGGTNDKRTRTPTGRLLIAKFNQFCNQDLLAKAEPAERYFRELLEKGLLKTDASGKLPPEACFAFKDVHALNELLAFHRDCRGTALVWRQTSTPTSRRRNPAGYVTPYNSPKEIATNVPVLTAVNEGESPVTKLKDQLTKECLSIYSEPQRVTALKGGDQVWFAERYRYGGIALPKDFKPADAAKVDWTKIDRMSLIDALKKFNYSEINDIALTINQKARELEKKPGWHGPEIQTLASIRLQMEPLLKQKREAVMARLRELNRLVQADANQSLSARDIAKKMNPPLNDEDKRNFLYALEDWEIARQDVMDADGIRNLFRYTDDIYEHWNELRQQKLAAEKKVKDTRQAVADYQQSIVKHFGGILGLAKSVAESETQLGHEQALAEEELARISKRLTNVEALYARELEAEQFRAATGRTPHGEDGGEVVDRYIQSRSSKIGTEGLVAPVVATASEFQQDLKTRLGKYLAQVLRTDISDQRQALLYQNFPIDPYPLIRPSKDQHDPNQTMEFDKAISWLVGHRELITQGIYELSQSRELPSELKQLLVGRIKGNVESGKSASQITVQALTNYLRAVDRVLASTKSRGVSEQLLPSFTASFQADPQSAPLDRLTKLVAKEVEGKAKRGAKAESDIKRIDELAHKIYGAHLPTSSRAALYALPSAARSALRSRLEMLEITRSADVKDWGKRVFNPSSHELMGLLLDDGAAFSSREYDSAEAEMLRQQVSQDYGQAFGVMMDPSLHSGANVEKARNEVISRVNEELKKTPNAKELPSALDGKKFDIDDLSSAELDEVLRWVMPRINPEGAPVAVLNRLQKGELSVQDADELRAWIHRRLKALAKNEKGTTTFSNPEEANTLAAWLWNLDHYGNAGLQTNKEQTVEETIEESHYYDPSYILAGLEEYQKKLTELQTVAAQSESEAALPAQQALDILKDSAEYVRTHEKREIPLMERLKILSLAQDPSSLEPYTQLMKEVKARRQQFTPQQVAVLSQALKNPSFEAVDAALALIDPAFSRGKLEGTIVREDREIQNNLLSWLTGEGAGTPTQLNQKARDPLTKLPLYQSATRTEAVPADVSDVREVFRQHLSRIWRENGVPESDTRPEARKKRAELQSELEAHLADNAVRRAFTQTEDEEALKEVRRRASLLYAAVMPHQDAKTRARRVKAAEGLTTVDKADRYQAAGTYVEKNKLDELGERYYQQDKKLDLEEQARLRAIDVKYEDRLNKAMSAGGQARVRISQVEAEIAYLRDDWAKSVERQNKDFKKGGSLNKEYTAMTAEHISFLDLRLRELDKELKLEESKLLAAETEVLDLQQQIQAEHDGVRKASTEYRKQAAHNFDTELQKHARRFLAGEFKKEDRTTGPSKEELSRQTEIFRKYLGQLSDSRRIAEIQAGIAKDDPRLNDLTANIPLTEDGVPTEEWVAAVNNLQPGLSLAWTHGLNGVGLGPEVSAKKIAKHYQDAIKTQGDLRQKYAAEFTELAKRWNIHFNGNDFDFSEAKLDAGFGKERSRWNQFFEQMAPHVSARSNVLKDLEDTLTRNYLANGGTGHQGVNLGGENPTSAIQVRADDRGRYEIDYTPLGNESSPDRRAQALIEQTQKDFKKLPQIIERAASLQNYWNLGFVQLPAFSDLFGDGPQWAASEESRAIRARLYQTFDELEKLGDVEVEVEGWGKVTARTFAHSQRLKLAYELEFLRRIKDKETWEDAKAQMWSVGTLAMAFGAPGAISKGGQIVSRLGGGLARLAPGSRLVGAAAGTLTRGGAALQTVGNGLRAIATGQVLGSRFPISPQGFLNGFRISAYTGAATIPQRLKSQRDRYQQWASLELRNRYARREPGINPPDGMDTDGDHVISDEEYRNFEWKNPRAAHTFSGNLDMGLTFGLQPALARQLQILGITKRYGLNTMIGGASASFALDQYHGNDAFDSIVRAIDRAFYGFQGDDYAAAASYAKFGKSPLGHLSAATAALLFNVAQDCIMGEVIHYRTKAIEGEFSGMTTQTYGQAEGYWQACWQNAMDGIGGTMYATGKALQGADETAMRGRVLSRQETIDRLKRIFGNPDDNFMNAVFNQVQVWKAQQVLDTLPANHASVKELIRMSGLPLDELKKEMTLFTDAGQRGLRAGVDNYANRRRDFSEFLRYLKDKKGYVPPGLGGADNRPAGKPSSGRGEVTREQVSSAMQTLGVPEGAPPEIIRQAYQAKSRKLAAEGKGKSPEMRALTDAWQVLRAPRASTSSEPSQGSAGGEEAGWSFP